MSFDNLEALDHSRSNTGLIGPSFCDSEKLAESRRKDRSRDLGSYGRLLLVDGKTPEEIGLPANHPALNAAGYGLGTSLPEEKRIQLRDEDVRRFKETWRQHRAKYIDNPSGGEAVALANSYLATMDWLETKNVTFDRKAGAVFTFSLMADDGELLDLEKPIQWQKEGRVGAAIRSLIEDHAAHTRDFLRGEQLHDLAAQHPHDPLQFIAGVQAPFTGADLIRTLRSARSPLAGLSNEEFSGKLAAAGIVGVRYHDAESRECYEKTTFMGTAQVPDGRWYARLSVVSHHNLTADEPKTYEIGDSNPQFSERDEAREWGEKHAGNATYQYIVLDTSRLTLTHINGQQASPEETQRVQRRPAAVDHYLPAEPEAELTMTL